MNEINNIDAIQFDKFELDSDIMSKVFDVMTAQTAVVTSVS